MISNPTTINADTALYQVEQSVQTATIAAEQAEVDSFSGPALFKTETLVEAIDAERAKLHDRIAFLDFAERHLVPLIGRCSDTLRPELTCGIPYFYVFNREDLAVLMTMAPKWDKFNASKGIQYTATIGGVFTTLMAYDKALPPTCRVVRTTRIVPAMEAHEVTEEAIVCEMAAKEGAV